MTSVHGHIVFIGDIGVTLATYGNALVVRSRTMPLTALPRNTHTIIMDGFGGSITTAVSWHDGALCAAPTCQCNPGGFKAA